MSATNEELVSEIRRIIAQCQKNLEGLRQMKESTSDHFRTASELSEAHWALSRDGLSFKAGAYDRIKALFD